MRQDRPTHVVVIGAGMVAHKFAETLLAKDDARRVSLTVIGDEPFAPYDRVHLTSFFSGSTASDLLLDESVWDDERVTLRTGTLVTGIDRDARAVETEGGEHISYDALVLATGSHAAVPPIEGRDVTGCFVYRTLDDVEALRRYVSDTAGRHPELQVRGAVIGGGLLGLEAGGALQAMGADTTVVEFADRLMPMQVDAGGGEDLKRIIEGTGVHVRTSTATARINAGDDGRVASMDYASGERDDVDVVVFATGIRPRDELARAAGLELGPRGGVLVDTHCATTDPAIHAIGEVACIQGEVWGLVAPGYTMAEIAAAHLLGEAPDFDGADSSTKLKLMGVDVASFGDAFAATPGAREVVYSDAMTGWYRKLVVADDGHTLLGGVLVGDASAFPSLRAMVGHDLAAPSAFVIPEDERGAKAEINLELPDDAGVCSCNNVSAGQIRAAFADSATTVSDIKTCTKAGTSCGSCLPLVIKLVEVEQAKAGIEVDRSLCEHMPLSRSQLFNAIKVAKLTSFDDVIERFGAGRGCDVCKPTIANILASLENGHVLDGQQATMQDTNDHVLANMQKDGTYSVVPRIPGGEVTPPGLVAIGQIAEKYGLYTKITGAQRIDMFGARIDQLPAIWRELLDAGFECGQAYGKSLRAVKSCVGQTWCRFGVRDSVRLAIDLETRYKGLRSPHKLKMGVSGCARECAEARGKDAGIIATENGWNLYVGGNGGFKPVHAQLLAEDLDDEELIRTIDRFFMFYISTAERLQRTAPWLAELEGGTEHLREVIMDDALGICADLDAMMERHVNAYSDEWRDVLEDPEKLARFTAFVNDDTNVDPDLLYVVERDQPRPATPAEKADATLELIDSNRRPVRIAGERIPVGAGAAHGGQG
ncbi:nitrite reductase large subunit NirB [Dermacoccus nishinomiyaensis]|uniref:nitrite reductase large subunit NirB n=1 Tax=Dermacoccus nishinomiyaensis TaxID=1274 RepID=UPI001F50EBAC|nr:nitrite reductase large subunit NirB [Dermacoccus nishinomiyaensis]MCI0153743.1 nitrite reductase large subunit NirB [Dermacoccus nishinomiyaensis]